MPLTADNAEPLPDAGEHVILSSEGGPEEAAQDAMFQHGASAARLPQLQSTYGGCGRRGASGGMKVCSRCRQVSYCSKACQKAAWKRHKETCQPQS